MGLCGILDVSSAENSRPARVSQGFSVLREMNYKYSQPGHWKCFPLHSSSQETYRGGEAKRTSTFTCPGSEPLLACGELMLEQQVLYSASQPASKDRLLPDY